MNRPRTITAKFAGTCAQTGARYPAGTPIYKGATGWIAAPNALTTSAPIALHDDRNDGRPYHDAPSRSRRESLCTYCERPCRGTVCDRCARACGESDDLSPDMYDGYDD